VFYTRLGRSSHLPTKAQSDELLASHSGRIMAPGVGAWQKIRAFSSLRQFMIRSLWAQRTCYGDAIYYLARRGVGNFLCVARESGKVDLKGSDPFLLPIRQL
jgi:hypothetical protein